MNENEFNNNNPEINETFQETPPQSQFQPIPPQPMHQQQILDKRDGLTNEIVCAALSFFLGQYVSFILAIISIIVGQTTANYDAGVDKTRKTLRKVAWILFGVGVGFTVLLVIAYCVIFGAALIASC